MHLGALVACDRQTQQIGINYIQLDQVLSTFTKVLTNVILRSVLCDEAISPLQHRKLLRISHQPTKKHQVFNIFLCASWCLGVLCAVKSTWFRLASEATLSRLVR